MEEMVEKLSKPERLELLLALCGGRDKISSLDFVSLAAKVFGESEQHMYMASERFYRPENFN